MAQTPSTRNLSILSALPEFTLPDWSGKTHSLRDRGTLPVVVMFVCNHCPFVIHLADAIGKLATEYKGKVAFFAINSNDIENYPDDAPEKMGEFANKHEWTFPYLFDEDQSVAKAYSAACTPDFFVGDGKGLLTYCGQFDDSRPAKYVKEPVAVDGRDLRAAIDRTLTNAAPLENQRPSIGCNIKWKPGNEPDYFKTS